MSKMNTNWEYRVVRQKSDNNDGSDYFTVQEVYFDDDGDHLAQSTDLIVEGESLPQLRKQLQQMIWALDKDVVDEMEVTTVDEDIPSETKVIGSVDIPNNYWE